MSIRRILVKNGLVLLASVSFLAGCKKDAPSAPDPVTPTTETTVTPPQYGTPFAGVPNREDAVMYQVNMRAFSQAGNFAGVTARLDSIRAIGVNVLYLMPIYPVGQATGTKPSYNSPYAVKDYRAVNAEFGSLADLRTLVDAAHARGMSVMLDWVANHTSWDNAWVTAHPDWYQKDAAGAIVAVTNPNDGTKYNDVAQLDFTKSAMRLAMISAMKSWVFTANVDGFRCDYADYQPNDFWKQASDTLRAVRTHKLLLLAEGTRAANFTSGFDYNFGFGFYGGIYNVYRNSQPATNFDALNTSEFSGATGTQGVVRYITNHDVNSSDGTPVALFGGQSGSMSAFVIAALYKGVPLIYNGQETGTTIAITFPFTVVSEKVNWNANRATTLAYKRLMAARAASTALRSGTPTAYSTANVCAFTKTAGSDQAFVLANVRNSAQTFTVPAALQGNWTNAVAGGTVAVGASVSLPAYGYLVLKK